MSLSADSAKDSSMVRPSIETVMDGLLSGMCFSSSIVLPRIRQNPHLSVGTDSKLFHFYLCIQRLFQTAAGNRSIGFIVPPPIPMTGRSTV